MKAKLVGIIIFVLLFTTIMPNFIYAEVNRQSFEEIEGSYTEDSFNKLKDEGKADIVTQIGSRTKTLQGTSSSGPAMADAIVMVFTAPVVLVSTLITLVTRGPQNTFLKNGRIINWFTIEDTVFNRIELFDANYFLSESNDKEFNGAIKNAVATFYYVTRTVAILCGLLMLIYLGIRMSISTIASEQAKYKEMLKDWLVSMILIFIMPYIIAMINFISGGFVQILANLSPASFEQNLIPQVYNLMNATTGFSHVAIALMYIVMTFYQVKFFFMYLNRMLSMGFLIIISPLITITYSATKTKIAGKGGKSAMFDTWFKEYTINAFIQPLHAAIYMVFMVSAAEIFMVAPLLAVIFFMALSRAEKIVKNILGMRKMTSIHSMSEYMKLNTLKNFKKRG